MLRFRDGLFAQLLVGAAAEYNTLRPYRGLGMMTPAAFAASRKEGPK